MPVMKSNFKSSFVLLSVVLALAATACAAPDSAGPEGTATASHTSISPTRTVAPTSAPTQTLTPTATLQPTSTLEPAAAYASEVIVLVNKERAANGLPALAVSTTLMDNAERWSVFMAENDVFYHSDYIVGENVGAGYLTPEEVVAGWMDSSGHRANILHPSFTQAGAGYAYSADSTYRHYWTLQFSP